MIVASGKQRFEVLTGGGRGASIALRNTPVSFGEGARSRSARAGSCFFSGNHCATANPRLARVQDPFGNLVAKVKGSVLGSGRQFVNAQEDA